jgi:Carboxypeptidase regulatory-like domain
MNRNSLRFILLLVLFLGSCNLPNPRPIVSSTVTPSVNIRTSPAVESSAPIPGDLGFGKISGKVTDSVTAALIAGATVTCKHFSYTSKESDRCNRNTTTDADGSFLFENVFFHDTDTITLIVEAAGYKPVSLKYASFTQPLLKADIQLSQ